MPALGINAHVNYDLPQALLAVIDVTKFGDAALLDRRRRDHERIDEVHAARVLGPETYRARLADLEVLSAPRIADLLAPGQVILRLAVGGFGVLLPPA
jgi:hypothetical protein